MGSGEATFDDFGIFDEPGRHAGYGDETYGGNFGQVFATAGPAVTEGASFILELDSGERLALDAHDDGWYVGRYDLGVPVPRVVRKDRPITNGTSSRTKYVGGRNIVLGLTLAGPNRQTQLDVLARFMDPGLRPMLICKSEKWDAYRRIRVEPTSGPDAVWEKPNMLAVTIGFASDGSPFFTGDELHEVVAYPITTAPGRTYPRSYPRVYPPAQGTGPAVARNRGSRPAEWVARIFGPTYNPRLIVAGTGEQVVFGDNADGDPLHIEAGDYLEVDSTTKTARVNGLADADRYDHLDPAETTPGWFKIAPAPASTVIRFTGDSGTVPPAQTFITYRDTYL